MNSEQFDSLVFKLEAQARKNPRAYPKKVLLLALLGNTYIALVLLALLVVVALLIVSITKLHWIAVKGVIFVVPVVWMILKSMWVTIEPPEGFDIEPSQAPDLFTLIDNLQHLLRAPRFHHVLITDEFNAAVVQSPRLGIFGWYNNYLLIGLPLLKTLSVEQFTSVLAHEFGHLAKGHGRISNWIYRQRLRWSRLLKDLEQEGNKGSFLFKPFLEWFSPYFNAFSFPLARANEYEADATSARLTSPRVCAEALTSVNVIGSYLSERFWPQVHKLADDQPKPNFAPYHALGQRVSVELDDISMQRWLVQAMAEKTTSADTHPALSDRLKAIGQEPALAPPTPDRQADKLLGAILPRVTDYFDESWQDRVSEVWERRHNEVKQARDTLAELDEKFASGVELTPQEAYDRARLTETAGNNTDSALDQFRALQERMPDNAFACLCLGARMLNRNDETGVALIDRAIDLDEDSLRESYELLRDYHWRNGREDEARRFHQQLIERTQLEAAAEEERKAVRLSDTYEKHELTQATLASLCEQLKDVEGLKEAYFVKKRVYNLIHKPVYVLGFTVERGFGLRPKYTEDEVMYRLQNQVEFPVSAFILSIGANKKIGRQLMRVTGARIF